MPVFKRGTHRKYSSSLLLHHESSWQPDLQWQTQRRSSAEEKQLEKVNNLKQEPQLSMALV